MDSFELNKIIAAVLMVALLVIGLNKISNGIFHVEKPEKPGYKVEVEARLTASSSNTTETAEKIDIAALMSLGDITHGKKVFKKCAACHSVVKGGGNKIGPALYNVVGRKVGAISDYKYSKALVAYDKEWTFEELRPYMEVALDAFGPKRLMFGSDWPVARLAVDYEPWADLCREFISTLSEEEREAIEGGNAIRAYRLD